MNASSPQHEPTMEEILASIRKIISEDQPEAPKAQAAPAEGEPSAEMTPAVEPEVLELTEEVREETGEEPAPEPEPAPSYENDVAFEALEEPPEAQQSEPPASEDTDIMSESARHAFDQAVGGLEDVEPAPAPVHVAGGSVEDVFARAVQDAFEPALQDWVDGHAGEIMDRLKPLIRDWMDENLPDLIETAVKKEISRAVRQRRR